MNNVNENKKSNVKLIKHFIKDLSFENPQSINDVNLDYNNNNSIDLNMKILHERYENNHFSLILKYIVDCTTKNNNKKLCYLELEYFGFFKILNKGETDQKALTKNGLDIIFPFAKEIIENVTRWGGSFPISLNSVDLSLMEN
tara:strand:- start:133 stop:561 length:429 start_codon:yes stop_codon:yes gene_type:complete